MRWRLLAVACLTSTISCYTPRFDGCNILCDDDDVCPGDLTCSAGYCRSAENDTCAPLERLAVIAAGGQHACSINLMGELHCWGANDHGQVNGAPSDPVVMAVRVAPEDIDQWIAVDAGFQHTCAIGRSRTDGLSRLYCWGDNANEQCGVQGSAPSVVPTELAIENPVEIAAGGSHTCVRLQAGDLQCWGSNSRGQLGDGEMGNSRQDPVEVNGGITDWLHVAAGNEFTCATRADGSVSCWGRNDHGQMGNGTEGGEVLVPTPVASSVIFDRTHPARAISLGNESVCVVHDDDGRLLRCWGDNSSREAGEDGGVQHVTTPNTIEGFGSEPIWVDVRTGEGFACGLSGDGQIYCWGLADPRLGDNCFGCRGGILGPSETFPLRDIADSALEGAFAFDVGAAFGCALFGTRESGGIVRCWGSNSHGQLGNGETTRITKATEAVQEAADDWKLVRMGRFFGCGVKDGAPPTVWCWGDNEFGQVTGTPGGPEPIPVQHTFAVGSTLVDLAVGDNHACAIVETTGQSAVKCWGSNAAQELGASGFDLDTSTPVLPDLGGLAWLTIHASRDATCLTNEGVNVVCWGTSPWLTLTTPPMPENISLLNNYRDLTMGPDGGCAFDVGDNSLDCWGSDVAGLLGDGPSTPSTPLPPRTITTVGLTGPFAGASDSFGEHRCAFNALGTICWGDNFAHQAGDPTQQGSFDTPHVLSPPFIIQPAMVPTLRTVTAGGEFTCAIDENQNVQCWGGNSFSQCTSAGIDNNGVPTLIEVDNPALDEFQTIAAGEATACALTSNVPRKLVCWGNSAHGEAAGGAFDRDHVVDPVLIAP